MTLDNGGTASIHAVGSAAQQHRVRQLGTTVVIDLWAYPRYRPKLSFYVAVYEIYFYRRHLSQP